MNTLAVQHHKVSVHADADERCGTHFIQQNPIANTISTRPPPRTLQDTPRTCRSLFQLFTIGSGCRQRTPSHTVIIHHRYGSYFKSFPHPIRFRIAANIVTISPNSFTTRHHGICACDIQTTAGARLRTHDQEAWTTKHVR